MSTKQNPCQYVIFSQNCCFVANFVDKGLVDDSTNNFKSMSTDNIVMIGPIATMGKSVGLPQYEGQQGLEISIPMKAN